MEKEYAVVKFIKHDNYSEIPTNWLLNTYKSKGRLTCRWLPQFIKNINTLLKNRITPKDDWPTYEINIRYCGEYKNC